MNHTHILAADQQRIDAQAEAKRTEPIFLVGDARFTLAHMLTGNRDDEGLCEWLRSAQVGDVFPAFVECRRVA